MKSRTDKLKPSERALLELRKRLNDEALREGSRLPPERELALDLGVSRRALREALGQLEGEGRIWRGVGRGTVVGPPPRKTQTSDEHKNLTSPTELLEARLALEPSVAALAAINATTRDLEEMHRCLKKSAGVSEHEGWDRWDGALHRAICHATHNAMVEALVDLLNSARSHTQWGQLRKASLTTDRQKLYTRQHELILAAITDRDSEQAEYRMRTHLLTVRETLLNPWGTESRQGRYGLEDER